MKKKRKIVISLIAALAFGLFVNITDNLDSHGSQSVKSTHSFTIYEDKGPIGGNH